MAEPAKDFTASFDALIASLRLREGEEAYNKCRARFFMDAMKFANDKVASGDPTAKTLEAEYATLVETRGSQNRIPKTEKASSECQLQTTEDLESKFQVLANAAGTLPGEPGYKRLLRKFLTAEYATNAQEYCSNARNVKDKNKMFKFEALALVCGLEYDSRRYNKLYNDFFQKTGILLASALESTLGQEEASSTKIMARGTNHSSNHSSFAAASFQKSEDESATMKNLRSKLVAARLDGAGSESAAQIPTPEARFQELVLSLGLTKGSRGYTNYRRQFFEYESSREHILKSGDDIAIKKLEKFEESCAALGLQQGTKEFRIFKSHFDIENENENDSEISSESSFSLSGFTSADDDSQYALQFRGRQHTSNGNNLHEAKSVDGVVTGGQRPNGKQSKRGKNRAQNEGHQKGDSQKDRAQKAKEDFDTYFGDPSKLENWQRLCRDLDIFPVPTSITKCRKETKKIYVNIYQFLHQTKTGFRATRFPNQAALAEYCNKGRKRKFPRNIAKTTGTLAGLLHYIN